MKQKSPRQVQVDDKALPPWRFGRRRKQRERIVEAKPPGPCTAEACAEGAAKAVASAEDAEPRAKDAQAETKAGASCEDARTPRTPNQSSAQRLPVRMRGSVVGSVCQEQDCIIGAPQGDRPRQAVMGAPRDDESESDAKKAPQQREVIGEGPRRQGAKSSTAQQQHVGMRRVPK